MKESTSIGATCALITSLFTASANAATFNVLGGTLTVTDPNSVTVDSSPLVGNGVLVEGLFDGSASAIATDANATYAGLDSALFLNVPVTVYFAPSGVFDDVGAPLHNAPTIDLGSMTADMTAMFANWNSTPPGYIGEFNVGGIASVVAIGPHTWELSWSHLQSTGPFQGMTSSMTMVVSQVPLPAAMWLFGPGLAVLLFGRTRREKGICEK